MVVKSVAMQAYRNAIQSKEAFDRKFNALKPADPQAPQEAFSSTLKDSLDQVNKLNNETNSMVESFASGETENVHDLMINLQKAGLAFSMTYAVRSKVMQAYQELMRMPF